MANTDNLTAHVGQEYRPDLAECLCLKVSHRCGSAVQSNLKAQLEEDKLPNSLPRLVTVTQLLTGFWTKGFSSLMTVDQRAPSISCHMCHSIGQLNT